MVHAQRHAPMHALQLALSQVQPQRVFGIASALAINVAALMLLMVPVSMPPAADVEIVTQPIWEIADPKPKPLPPPVMPVEAPKTKPIVQHNDNMPAKVSQSTTQISTTIPDDISDDARRAIDVTPPPGNIIDPPFGGGGGGEIGATAHLEYASAPPPTYPREALLDNIQGTVLLKVLVDVDGKPLSVEIARSSGSRALDEAARRQVLRKWTFQPAMQNGVAIQVYGMVPVNFSLSMQ